MKTYCILHDDSKTVEEFLLSTFLWSGQFYKKQKFPVKWRSDLCKSKMELEIPLHCLNHGKISNVDTKCVASDFILDETEYFVALYKNQNMHSHPLGYGETNNILSVLRHLGRDDLLDVNNQSYDRGLLYRLDFETSGLIIYAKTSEVYEMIRKNFSQIMRKKIYIAKCEGHLEKSNDILNHFLKPQGTNRHKIVCFDEFQKDSTECRLKYELLNYDEKNNFSEVLVFLETGYRHQIRSQFSKIGHPLCGDILYGGAASKRLYLHSSKYELFYNDKSYVFEAPLPKEW